MVAHGESGDLPADLGVQYVGEFVARRVSLDVKRGDANAEIVLESIRGPEHEDANARVKTISTDDKIEVTLGAAREPYADTRFGLINGSDRIAEDHLDSIFKRAVECCGELAALHGDVPSAGDAQEAGYARSGDATSPRIDDAQLPDDVTAARDLR